MNFKTDVENYHPIFLINLYHQIETGSNDPRNHIGSKSGFDLGLTLIIARHFVRG